LPTSEHPEREKERASMSNCEEIKFNTKSLIAAFNFVTFEEGNTVVLRNYSTCDKRLTPILLISSFLLSKFLGSPHGLRILICQLGNLFNTGSFLRRVKLRKKICYKKVFEFLWRLIINLLHIMNCLVGINQNLDEINNPVVAVNHLMKCY
jgi:hypothetical protein